MKKIPTLFERDDKNRRFVTDRVTPGCEWVFESGAVATRKWDGTCVMYDGTVWWFRREVKGTANLPEGFVPIELDPVTGKTFGWERESSAGWGPRLVEALDEEGTPHHIGTYELCGPKINGNPEQFKTHRLLRHGATVLFDVPNDSAGIRAYVAAMEGEGIVWWGSDGKWAKLKRRDIRVEVAL